MEQTRYFKGKVYKKNIFNSISQSNNLQMHSISIDKNTIRIQLHFFAIYSATVRGAVWLTKVFQGPLATILYQLALCSFYCCFVHLCGTILLSFFVKSCISATTRITITFGIARVGFGLRSCFRRGRRREEFTAAGGLLAPFLSSSSTSSSVTLYRVRKQCRTLCISRQRTSFLSSWLEQPFELFSRL